MSFLHSGEIDASLVLPPAGTALFWTVENLMKSRELEVMEHDNFADALIKSPGILDHTTFDDAVMSMMSTKSKTFYYHVLMSQVINFLPVGTLQGQWRCQKW